MYFFVLLLVFVEICGGEETTKLSENSRISRDSYIDAYTETHGGNLDLNNVNPDREMSFPSGFPDEQFGEQYPYPPPSYQQHHYGPPQPSYGAPHPPAYGPQRPIYGPPPPHNYGPPAPPMYGIPYGMLAIISLLLFIPWLKAKKALHHHGGGGGGAPEHDEEDLLMRKNRENNRLNNITVYVLEAINDFTKKDFPKSSYDCDTWYCRVNRFAKTISNRVMMYEK